MRKPLLIPKQIPEFLRTEYPAFVEFMQLYYEWLETQQIGSIESLVDIDKTVDDFIQYFRKEFDVNGIDYEFISPRLFLRKSKELFTAKGSEAAIKFLFRILYGKASEVITPWKYVLIPSEGKWYQDLAIFVSVTKGSGADLTTKYITITGTDGRKYRAFVRAVGQVSTNVYQLFLDPLNTTYVNYDCQFVSEDLTTEGVLLRTTAKVTIVDGGYDFEVGQLFTIEGFSGQGTIVKVKAVNDNGTITAAEVIQFGLGYNVDFTTQIYPKDSIAPQNVASITLTYDEGGNSSPDLIATYLTDDKIKNPTEAMLFTRHNYTNTAAQYWTIGADEIVTGAQYKIVTVGDTDYTLIGAPNNNIGTIFTAAAGGSGTGTVETLRSFFLDSTYVGEIIGETRTQENHAIVTRLGAATLLITTGGIAKYPGYYLSGESILSDLSYIQDSYRYQKYSYVTSIEEELDTYKDILKKTLHPIGTQLLGEYRVVNNLPLTATVDSQLNLLPRSTILDSVLVDQTAFSLTPGKNLTDTVVALADVPVFEVGKNVTDVVSTATDTTKDIGKNLTDAASTSDSINIEAGKTLSDSAATNDAISLDTNKTLSDDATTSNAGGVFLGPLYYDVTEAQYWAAGYLENETAITN